MLEKNSIHERPTFGPFKYDSERIATIHPEATVKEAAEMMRKRHIGDLIVTRGLQDYPLGILTDRDFAIRVFASDTPIEDLTVRDVMSGSMVCAHETDDLFTIVALMKKNGVVRLPVVKNGGQLVGVVTARNVIRVLAETLDDLTRIGEKQQAREHASTH